MREDHTESSQLHQTAQKPSSEVQQQAGMGWRWGGEGEGEEGGEQGRMMRTSSSQHTSSIPASKPRAVGGCQDKGDATYT